MGRHGADATDLETEFLIDTDGSVANFRLRATTLTDIEAADCVARGFSSLKFPPPDGG
jgi:hypothetical protein